MKNLQFIALLFLIPFVLISCQKEEILEVPSSLIPQSLEKAPGKKHPVPFHATFTSTVTGTPTSPDCGAPPIFNLLQSVSGNATHMGNLSGTISSCIDPVTPAIFNGQVILIAANGDEVWFDQSGPLSFDINGGTGRFDDATGNVEGSFQILGPGMFLNIFDGEIQY